MLSYLLTVTASLKTKATALALIRSDESDTKVNSPAALAGGDMVGGIDHSRRRLNLKKVPMYFLQRL